MKSDGFFSLDRNSGPSKTLIEWKQFMWYDFSIDQTRFEGEVRLKYFSGAQLDLIRGRPIGDSADTLTGRSTFLGCDVLTVDFLDREQRRPGDTRMGRLSAERLRQFHAQGTVTLQDQAERLWLTADEVVYEQQRRILVIHGRPHRRAHIIMNEPGQLPNQVTAERLLLNLDTRRIEASNSTINVR